MKTLEVFDLITYQNISKIQIHYSCSSKGILNIALRTVCQKGGENYIQRSFTVAPTYDFKTKRT
jgi:hypothetical protein